MFRELSRTSAFERALSRVLKSFCMGVCWSLISSFQRSWLIHVAACGMNSCSTRPKSPCWIWETKAEVMESSAGLLVALSQALSAAAFAILRGYSFQNKSNSETATRSIVDCDFLGSDCGASDGRKPGIIFVRLASASCMGVGGVAEFSERWMLSSRSRESIARAIIS